MRTYPEDKFDLEESERLKTDEWILNLLKMNPEYPFWGPYEDYMIKDGDSWDSRIIKENWKGFNNSFGLNYLNEVVNFYFEAVRNSVKCETCGGCGDHPDSQWITESFYQHSSPFCKMTQKNEYVKHFLGKLGCDFDTTVVEEGFPSEELLDKYPEEFRQFCEEMKNGDGYWNDKITQDEFELLIENGRERGCVSLYGMNKSSSNGLSSYDAISRSYLCEQRCKRLGVPLYCKKCDGYGKNYTEEKAHLELALWVLHPRKGCSRGVKIKRVEQSDLSDIFSFLKEAAKRNAERFSKIIDKIGDK